MEPFTLSLDTFRRWCAERNIQHRVDEELKQVIVAGRPGMEIRVVPRPERSMMSFGITLPFLVPRDRYDAYSRALSLVNSATFMGAWVLNHGTGESYFRITVPVGDIRFTDGSLLFLLRAVLGTVDVALDNLRLIALEGAPAESVLRPDQLPPGSVQVDP